VLVHDAARPCLGDAHLLKLINELQDDVVGGILAVPVADTLKRSDADQRIQKTENREQLWQAQTPQMFRAGLLAHALQQCKAVTDEASAIEALGLSPKLVAGDSSNFKVTYPQDLRLAELLLKEKTCV
jgi:2-C-methyl-D-erythritol 4-phosphate cytidylyltransferase